MTLKEFLDWFYSSDTEWVIHKPIIARSSHKGNIREKETMLCPVSYKCNLDHETDFSSAQAFAAGLMLGLTSGARYNIVNAADGVLPSTPLSDFIRSVMERKIRKQA